MSDPSAGETGETTAGTGASDDGRDDGVEPWEAFALLGDRDRYRILTALRRADDRPLAFSRLRERAAFADSGRFNYHLQQLVGPVLTRDPAGYDLTDRAERLLDAVPDTRPAAAGDGGVFPGRDDHTAPPKTDTR